MKDEYLLVNGIKTHFLRTGAGKPLLLVHGLGAAYMWQPVIDPLSKLFDVIVIDLPGFGESDCPPVFYSSSDYAVFLNRFLDGLQCSRVSVVGISYGGEVAATFASMFSGRLDALVLIAGTGLQKSRWIARNEIIWTLIVKVMKLAIMKNKTALSILSRRSYFDIRNQPHDLIENFMKPLSDPAKRDVWMNTLRKALLPDPNFQEVVRTINCATLILWGNEDRSIPVKYAYELHRMIKQSHLKIIAKCGHSVPLEKPTEACRAIQDLML